MYILYTYTYLHVHNINNYAYIYMHTHPPTHIYEKGNNPIQMMLNKLHHSNVDR